MCFTLGFNAGQEVKAHPLFLKEKQVDMHLT